MKKNFLRIFLYTIFILLFTQNCTYDLYANSNINNFDFMNNSTNDNAITQVLFNIVKLLTGKIARSIAVVAIVVVAVGLFMGKFSWGVGVATAIGIGMIFGAPNVVDWLTEGFLNPEESLRKYYR